MGSSAVSGVVGGASRAPITPSSSPLKRRGWPQGSPWTEGRDHAADGQRGLPPPPRVVGQMQTGMRPPETREIPGFAE